MDGFNKRNICEESGDVIGNKKTIFVEFEVLDFFLAKGRCFLCLTSVFSTILCHSFLFSVVSQPIFPFGILA